MSSPSRESGSPSSEPCVDEFHTSLVLDMGINSDDEAHETDFVTRWLTSFPTNTSAQMECDLERVNWDDILRRNQNHGSTSLEFTDDSSQEGQPVLYSSYNSNANIMFPQSAKQAYGPSLAHYQAVVSSWQEHGDGQLCHTWNMSESGSFPCSASEIEFAREQYCPNFRYVSPDPSEDAFDQNKLINSANSPEATEPYHSLSSRIWRQNVELEFPHSRFEIVSVNEEDDAISKPPRSDGSASISSREGKFKEQGKLSMKRKADQSLDNPLAPPSKRVTSRGSKTINCQTNESEEDRPPSNKRNGRHRSQKGPATDPQSVYARNRRERINERLKILQNLVPNGAKVDISTMLDEAVRYVKFLQLQVKFLSSDKYWMYTPIAFNGIDIAFNIQNAA